MKQFVFRFDIDSHKCAREGVPNLVQLAREENVSFTFFLNTGKAISKFETFKELIPKWFKVEVPLSEADPHLPAILKLGMKDYLYAAIINPNIAKNYAEQIKAAAAAGHEVGLHGGRNHATWVGRINKWDLKRITQEIQWGISQLKYLNLEASGFASPGACSNSKVIEAVANNGFRYIADELGRGFKPHHLGDLISIPTELSGRGKVAYIEAFRAAGRTDDEIMNQFTEDLKINDQLVMYDHPYFAGVQEIEILRKMIQAAKNAGFRIVSLFEMVNYFEESKTL